MLSLIICSRKSTISDELLNNISYTIGLKHSGTFLKENYGSAVSGDLCVMDSVHNNQSEKYEIVVVDNSENKYNIFSAYNEGIRRSRGDIVCFMHEDILYHTSNWGRIVIEYFKNPQIGAIGVNGTHFMAKYASPWWASAMNSGQLIQGSSNNGTYSSKQEFLWGRKGDMHSIEVVAVDGLWVCIRRTLFNNDKLHFDETSYSGFHCYDTDICMQILTSGFQVHVVYDILIEHKSLGVPDTYYFSQLDIWFNKWKDFLPISRGVRMSVLDVEEREKICEQYTDLFRSNESLIKQLVNIKKSKSYLIGKFLRYFFTCIH